MLEHSDLHTEVILGLDFRERMRLKSIVNDQHLL